MDDYFFAREIKLIVLDTLLAVGTHATIDTFCREFFRQLELNAQEEEE